MRCLTSGPRKKLALGIAAHVQSRHETKTLNERDCRRVLVGKRGIWRNAPTPRGSENCRDDNQDNSYSDHYDVQHRHVDYH
jgi:hypothetical protein